MKILCILALLNSFLVFRSIFSAATTYFLLNTLAQAVTLFKYRICSRNFRPRVFCAPWFLKDDFGFIFVPRISRTVILLFLIGVVLLAPQHEVASRTHRSTINWIFTMFSLIIDYWIDNGIYSHIISYLFTFHRSLQIWNMSHSLHKHARHLS